MKKYFAISILLLFFGYNALAQGRGVKIGYIDMEYILQNVPDYTEAKNQLEQKAEKWKQDIEAKKVEIAKLKDQMAKTGIDKGSIVRRTWMAESILLFKQKKAMAAIKVIDQLIDALPSAPGPKEYQYLCDFVKSKTKDKAALKFAQTNWCKFGLR